MAKENNEKRQALEMAMGQIEKQFGKGSVMKLGEYKAMNIEAIPTGALSLDIALGIGGVPRRKNNRNIWSRKLRKNNIGITYNSRSTKTKWRSCIY